MTSTAAPESGGRRRSPGTILLLVVLAALVLLAAGAFLPRWWSHRVADQANGSFTSGILLGLFYGFVFTVVALGVLWIGLRRVHSWKRRLLLLGVALLLASPNLLTLAIVIGPGGAAHAGERTLDVDAPGFRASSLAGVGAAVLSLATVGLLLRSRRRSREETASLRAALDEARHPPSPS